MEIDTFRRSEELVKLRGSQKIFIFRGEKFDGNRVHSDKTSQKQYFNGTFSVSVSAIFRYMFILAAVFLSRHDVLLPPSTTG